MRALCFDLFDTLVDLSFEGLPRLRISGHERPTTAGILYELVPPDRELGLEVFAETLAAVDRENRKIQHRDGIEISTRDRFDRLLERFDWDDPELASRLADRHMELFRRQVSVPEHHAAILEDLASRYTLLVCSNFTDTASAHAVLAEAGLAQWFQHVVVSEEVGFRKPRAEIFDAMLERAGVAASEVIHIGDNLAADVSGAKARGIRAGWLTRRVDDPGHARATYRGAAPDFEIADLRDLALHL